MKASLIVGLFLTAFLWAGEQPKSTDDVLIFTNVNVVGMRDGEIAQGVTLVIKKGRISGLAKVGFVGQGRNIQIVNAHGKYLIPGLWDMHVHSAFISPAWDEKVIYPLYIANGVTGVRDMGGDPDVLEARRKRIESGELLGPHLRLAGPFLAAGKSDRQTIAVNTPEDARQAVDTVKKRGLDFVKILSVSRESYFAIAEESAKEKIPFVGHVPHSVERARGGHGGAEKYRAPHWNPARLFLPGRRTSSSGPRRIGEARLRRLSETRPADHGHV